MEGSPLFERINSELEVLESIYSEDNLIQLPATDSPTSVTCTLKLQPATG